MAENEKNDLQKVEKKAAKTKSNKPSFFQKAGAWFKGLFAECKKITWAKWKDVKSNTAIVLVCVIAFAIVIGVLDFVFRHSLGGLNDIVNLIRG